MLTYPKRKIDPMFTTRPVIGRLWLIALVFFVTLLAIPAAPFLFFVWSCGGQEEVSDMIGEIREGWVAAISHWVDD